MPTHSTAYRELKRENETTSYVVLLAAVALASGIANG